MATEERHCLVCGNSLAGRPGPVRTCSEICRLERKRQLYRKRQAANPEKAREANRKWRAANPEKEREHMRKWRAANREKYNENSRKRHARYSAILAAVKELGLIQPGETA